MVYGYTKCRNCQRRLRFNAKRAGEAVGLCPLCKAMFVYPVDYNESDF